MATPPNSFHQFEQQTPRDQVQQQPSNLRFSPADDPQLYRAATAGAQSDVTKLGFPNLSIGDEQGAANRGPQFQGGDRAPQYSGGDSNPNLISSVPNDVIGQLSSLGALWAGIDNSANPLGITPPGSGASTADSSADCA